MGLGEIPKHILSFLGNKTLSKIGKNLWIRLQIVGENIQTFPQFEPKFEKKVLFKTFTLELETYSYDNSLIISTRTFMM